MPPSNPEDLTTLLDSKIEENGYCLIFTEVQATPFASKVDASYTVGRSENKGYEIVVFGLSRSEAREVIERSIQSPILSPPLELDPRQNFSIKINDEMDAIPANVTAFFFENSSSKDLSRQLKSYMGFTPVLAIARALNQNVTPSFVNLFYPDPNGKYVWDNGYVGAPGLPTFGFSIHEEEVKNTLLSEHNRQPPLSEPK